MRESTELASAERQPSCNTGTMSKSPRALRAELESSGALTTALEVAAKGEGAHPVLNVAAALVEQDAMTKACGLGAVLQQLAALETAPEDLTTWLCARLRENRPVAIAEYAEPVLAGLVMKCDEFANIHLLKTERPHPQVWNFRKSDGDLPVFGVGQCHLDGLAFLVKHLKDDLGFAKVKWFNMREEPVVFLNGQACAPRTAGNMNENVEYLMSIEGHELDAIEKRLCADCVAFANEAESKSIGCFYQLANGDNEEKQLATAEKTLPMRGGYDWLKTQPGAAVEYYRVPIADETAPEEKDFDQLIAELRGAAAEDSCALVFNCQMGRGRTTTGMVAAAILCRASRGLGAVEVKKVGRDQASEARNRTRGEFASVLELLDLIDKATGGRGDEAKALADACCDACAHAQNMVEAIVACESSASKAEPGAARSPEFWRTRARNYLERYAYVVLFAAYALENAKAQYAANFSEWSHKHWQFKRVIKHLTLA